MERWIFGIDGGATRSRIRAEGLSGELLYEGALGGLNPRSTAPGMEKEVLRGLLRDAFRSGLDPRVCAAGYAGCAGVDRPSDGERMKALLAEAFRAEALKACGAAAGDPTSPGAAVFSAGNDAEAALAGALADTEGFILAAGTGSIAFGRSRSGKSVRAGGWGHVLGEEGSGYWIAREALRMGLRSAEGREAPSGLLDAALGHFGLSEPWDLLPLAYENFDKARIASLAPSVARLAAGGDPAAKAILEKAAEELGALAVSVLRRLEPEPVRKRLALQGGLLEGSAVLRAAVVRRLAADAPGLEIVEPAGNAAAGACRLARELLPPGAAVLP